MSNKCISTLFKGCKNCPYAPQTFDTSSAELVLLLTYYELKRKEVLNEN